MSREQMTTTAPNIVVEDKGLKRGALGLVSSVVVGLASTAPAYSLAATLGLVIAAGGTLLAGVKAPAIMLISFVPMYLIAVAYQEEQGRARLRHHVHLGRKGFRAGGRVARRVGHHRLRRHRDGQSGTDRRVILLHIRR